MEKITPPTSTAILAEIATEQQTESAAQLKDLLRATGQLVKERKGWQTRRQKEIDEIKAIEAEAVKLFDAGQFDEDAQKAIRHRLFKIKLSGGRPMTEEQRAEAVERFKNRYRHENRGGVTQGFETE